MNPWLDQIAVGVIVSGALGFFVLRFFRNRKRNGGDCGGGCCAVKKK